MRKIKYKKGRKVQFQPYEYTGSYTLNPTEMQLFVYNEAEVKEYVAIEVSDFVKKKNNTQNNWLNLHGLTSVEIIKSLAQQLNLNTLIVSDIVNIARGTRLDELDDCLFFSVKSILPNEKDTNAVQIEQISFLMRDQLLVSFQEKKGDFFTHIRERLRQDIGIVRKKKVDYLLYLMLDAILENYYITIDHKETIIEQLLMQSKTSDNPEIIQKIEENREVFHLLKRSLTPLKDALYIIKTIKDDNEFNSIESSNFIFFNRLHQKTMELLEQIDYDMNSLDSANNFYYTTQGHKMNEVMKTLTVISSVFLPLTFLAGIYGMNFKYMPELESPYGYFILLIIMVVLGVGMLVYFKKKKWF